VGVRGEVCGSGSFYRRAGSVGGGFGQWKGVRAVPSANGCEHGDVGAVREDDVVGLASARRAGEGRVEREGGSVCVFSSLFRFRVWVGLGCSLLGLGSFWERGEGPGWCLWWV
jgi:hypothetical protein